MGGSEGYDPVMLELFRAEMETHLPALSQGLLTVEKGRAGEKDFEAMMRAAHSIKGAARIVGIEAAVRVAHGMEDCFAAAQRQGLVLGSEAVDVLLQGVDALQRICGAQPEAQVTQESLESLLEQIAAVREGRLARAGGQPAAPVTSAHRGELAAPAAESARRLTLPGALDDEAAESLRMELVGSFDQGASHVCLDFRHVRQVSAAALSLLASLARESAHQESVWAIEATGVSAPVAALLRTTGLDRVFKSGD